MAERVDIKTITVPAGTTIAAPQSTVLGFREGDVERVEIRIPPGPSGLMGVALARSGRKMLPKNASEWLITDNEPVIWPLEGYGTSASWSVLAYNLDIFTHTFQVRMLFKELHGGAPARVEPIDFTPPIESTEDEADFPEYVEDLPEVTA